MLTVTSLALSQACVAVQQKVTQHHHAAKQGSVKVALSQSLGAHQRGRKERRGRLSLPVKAKILTRKIAQTKTHPAVCLQGQHGEGHRYFSVAFVMRLL